MISRLLVLALPTVLLASLPCSAARDERGPNIVVILADDLGLRDLKLYGGWIETPRIERMAAEGLTLTDFHANSSVCSPTRAAFFTGRYQQRAGIVDVIVGSKEPDSGLLPSTPTLPRVFKDGGYATALFGKWHCGYQDRFNPVHHGFDEFVGLLNGAADYHQHGSWRNGLKQQDVEGYSTDIITSRSADFIRRHRKEPFFLLVSHQTPHNPYQTREDTPENRPEGWKPNRVSEENRPRYVEMVKDLDDSVGKILDTLKETGLDRRTLVFFWSDNGDVEMSPEPGPFRGRKFSQYEAGHRVPAVAWWPGKIRAGTTSDALIIGFDLFPTLTAMVGIDEGNPDNLDGTDASEHLLKGTPLPDRDVFFGYEPKLGTAMRRGDWKLIIKEDDLQLYDLGRDPKETTNIAAEHPEVTKSMQQAIDEFKRTVVPGS